MKAICVHEIGGPDVLRFEEMPNPQPGPGQVLIRQRAVAVNFIDTYFRSGLYKTPSLPFVPGAEGAGEIAALGEGVTNFRVGERVAYVANLGAYAELRVVAADRLVKVPDTVSDYLAGGQAFARGLTAWFLLRRTFQVRPGQTILWHAAAGGLGLIAGQSAAHLGANVIGTVGFSHLDKERTARANGYHHIIDSSGRGLSGGSPAE